MEKVERTPSASPGLILVGLAFGGTSGATTFISAPRAHIHDGRGIGSMTERRRRGQFAEFERQVLQAASNGSFKSHFSDLSRAGDRPGMIGLVLDVVNSGASLQVAEHFQPKDEARAAELLSSAGEDDAERLTEALGCAEPDGRLYLEALARRARAWFRTGQYGRCAKDCRHYCQRLGEGRAEEEEARVDLLLMRADCCKAAGRAAEARVHLNEAMRRIGDLAADGEAQQSDDFKARKAELLKEFLRRKQELGTARAVVNPEEEKKLPNLEGNANEFLINCSDAIALGHNECKGRLLYATRDINPGSVLIIDRPFAFSTDVVALHRNCLNCHASLRLEHNIRVPCDSCQTVQFCSDECRQQAWNKFHKYECRIFDYFHENQFQRTNSLLAYRTVIAAALRAQDNLLEIDREFLQLHETDRDVLDIKTLLKYESHDYKTVYSLETHCVHAEPKGNLERAIHATFFAQCLIHSLSHFHPEYEESERHLQALAVALLRSMQAIGCNAYEIVENVRDEETKILEPRNVGGAIYTSVSLTNHSCYPNIVRHSFPCGTVVVRSIRFIPQGSEILDCYGQHFLEGKRVARRELMARKYCFECNCEACKYDWPMSLPSDRFNFKCNRCSKQCRRTRSAAECTGCGLKTDIGKLYALLQNSIKRRLTALTKMYDGCYEEALPLLLEHGSCIDKVLVEPSLEAVKTQQSIVQCFNATSATSV